MQLARKVKRLDRAPVEPALPARHAGENRIRAELIETLFSAACPESGWGDARILISSFSSWRDAVLAAGPARLTSTVRRASRQRYDVDHTTGHHFEQVKGSGVVLLCHENDSRSLCFPPKPWSPTPVSIRP